MKIGFDNDKYLKMQSEHIKERIAKFDNKLYLEFGGKLFFRQLDTIPRDTGKDDFQRIPIRTDSLDLYGFMGRRRFADNGLCRKIKRNAQYVRIFDIEQSFFIQIVGLPAKRTANDLFAQQLRT